MNHKYVRSCGIAALLLTQPAFAQTKIVLDDADSGRVFEGLGAVSSGGSSRNFFDYPGKQKSEILDYMFKPKFGAHLQHLKVGLSGGENDTDGSEPTHALTREELADPKPRGYEFWLMAEARKRNPQILLDCLAWSYPGWIPKENKLKVPPLATGKIDGFTPATWHHLTLVLKGDELTASIDGKEVARVRYEKFYPAHNSGRAYLMSSYDANCFDNINVTP